MGKESLNKILRPYLDESFTKKSHLNRFSDNYLSTNKAMGFHSLKSYNTLLGAHKLTSFGRRPAAICKHLRVVVFATILMVLFFLLDSLMLSVIHHMNFRSGSGIKNSRGLKDGWKESDNKERTQRFIHGRFLNLASNAFLKNESHNTASKLWEEPYREASQWKPCAGKHIPVHPGHGTKQTGFILVSANGGLNQQRVAVCNAVAVAVMLNASLVIPKFLYSSVWKDTSQFGDIYQEQYFIDYLKDDLNIVRELPSHLQSLDFEAIGSQITDMDIMKESEPIQLIGKVLPLLKRNEVVHFLGFGNRLGFDPLPSNLQRLRCKCNFHALKFVPRIQEIGSLLIQRIRNNDLRWTELYRQLLGNHIPVAPVKRDYISKSPPKYLALHLRFEIDMVAYSLCHFGGGDKERKELQTYREIHFPMLVARMRNNSVSPEDLRKSGKCPLTPEEEALVLSALGYTPETYIYLAGSHIYGGKSGMQPFTSLFPNLVTKEDLLSASELAPFRNFSSQLAALDFIACATADVFAMTDTGSQLSSLVSGYRIYHGRGNAPTLRPNKKRLARILSESSSIKWTDFVDRINKMIVEGQRVLTRRRGRSIYRQPRSPECMCKV